MFFKISVVKSFATSAGKYMCSSLFNKVEASRPAALLKKRLWHRCFPVNFVKFLKTPLVAVSVNP